MYLDPNDTFTSVEGAGGCGKSTLARTQTDLLAAATTGIAAINSGGRTINSILGYFDTADLLRKVSSGQILEKLLAISTVWGGISLDEISMLPGQQLDLICHSIEAHNKLLEDSPRLANKHKTLRLLVLGDAGQLPQVSKQQSYYIDDSILDLCSSHGTPYFEAKYWSKFKHIYLTEVKRQTDVDFVNNLLLIREGRIHDAINWIENNIEISNEIDEDFKGSTFFPTNRQVDEYNKLKLDQLPGKVYEYESVRRGDQIGDWKHIPDILSLKEGCKVMILSNNFQEGYVNGDLGTIIGILTEGILVELFRNGNKVVITYKKLDNTKVYKNKTSGKYFSKSIGSIEYLPVRQGDSTTIHKSQSLTLEAVQGVVNHSFLERLSGGFYTLMSRVVRPSGLRLVGTREQIIRACYINPKYLNYIVSTKYTSLAA